jgi:hypothetical protein
MNNSSSSWEMFTKNGYAIPMPADTFVFWGTLVENIMVSSPNRTAILWCLQDNNICFGSTVLDAEQWSSHYGATVSGQWRVVNDGKLTLLRECDASLFPITANFPGWLQRKLQNHHSFT